MKPLLFNKYLFKPLHQLYSRHQHQQQLSTPEAPAPAATPASDDSKYITVKSPIIGTFYRKPAPDKPVFVEVGTDIKEGDVLVCN
jgi:biotin carboxyl carrier protein